MYRRYIISNLLFNFTISIFLLGILFIGGSPNFDKIYIHFQVQASNENSPGVENQSGLCIQVGIIGPTFTGPDGCPQPCPTDIQHPLPEECKQPPAEDSDSVKTVPPIDADILTQQPPAEDSDSVKTVPPIDADILTQQPPAEDSDSVKTVPPIDADILTEPSLSLCASDITGKWNGNDGGIYYIRQIGNDIWWFGTNVFNAGSEFNIFSNVLHGTRSGLTIDAQWQDVPLGDTKSKGDISLTIAPTGEKISKKSASGGFGGNTWIKKCDQIAKSKLPTDAILDDSDTGITPFPKGSFNDNIINSSTSKEPSIKMNDMIQ
jgi:hypothetical protein